MFVSKFGNYRLSIDCSCFEISSLPILLIFMIISAIEILKLKNSNHKSLGSWLRPKRIPYSPNTFSTSLTSNFPTFNSIFFSFSINCSMLSMLKSWPIFSTKSNIKAINMKDVVLAG